MNGSTVGGMCAVRCQLRAREGLPICRRYPGVAGIHARRFGGAAMVVTFVDSAAAHLWAGHNKVQLWATQYAKGCDTHTPPKVLERTG